MLPRSGDVLLVGSPASVQFGTPILFRVIRVLNRVTYEGWIWLDGYELNAAGDAVLRREIFVQVAGLRPIGQALDPRTRNSRRPETARAGRLLSPSVDALLNRLDASGN
jgi:hypothetical protein